MTAMEFEGRTERDAVAKAAAELGSESFDVEVLEKGSGLFGRGKVRIRVRNLSSIPDPMASGDNSKRREDRPDRKKAKQRPALPPEAKEEPQLPVDPPTDKVKKSIAEFVQGMIEHMELSGSVTYKISDEAKLIFEIESDSSSIIIGKKGRNLDALQLLANVYLNRITGDTAPWRIVLDIEGYRERREESLIRMAHRAADETVRNQSSRLLEPLNPFERRLIHTTISERNDVITKSEGDGLYKRVRIMVKGASRSRSRKRR